MRFRWLLPFGALLLADLIGIGCAILLYALGSGGIVATGLAFAGTVALAFFFGIKVGESRVGRALSLWDINVATVLYGVLSASSFDGMGYFLLGLAAAVAKVAAFIYGLQRRRPGFFIKASASSPPDTR